MDHLIELHDLTRTFGAFTALDRVTLALPPGRVGLLGPNGAGKSTLLKVLMGLIPPTAGTGRVLDQDLGGDRDAAGNWRLRRLIGFMPEADALVPGLTGIEHGARAGADRDRVRRGGRGTVRDAPPRGPAAGTRGAVVPGAGGGPLPSGGRV